MNFKNRLKMLLDSESEIKWLPVKWLNNEITKYEISNIGLVRNSKTQKILKTNFSKGYERVNLTHKGIQKQFFIHRLVATAFINNPLHKEQVNHINGDKSNNNVYNLEWVTSSENIKHAFDNGLNHHSDMINRISDKDVKKICKLLEENKYTIKKIADIVGTSRQTVSSILNKSSHTDISKNYNINNYIIKTSFTEKGENSSVSKYTNDQIKEICEMTKHYESLQNIPESFTYVVPMVKQR